MIQEDIHNTVAESFPDVKDIELELTGPAVDAGRMSDDAKFILGFADSRPSRGPGAVVRRVTLLRPGPSMPARATSP